MDNVESDVPILEMFRITRKDKGTGDRVPTWKVKVLFQGPKIGEKVWFFTHGCYSVDPFVPFAQCYNCFRFNHYQQHCKQSQGNCRTCFLRHQEGACSGLVTCSNCGGAHSPIDRNCPARTKAYAIKEKMTIENLSLVETKIRYPVLFDNRFAILEQDVEGSFPALPSPRGRGPEQVRNGVNHQQSARNLHAAFPYSKVARHDPNRARETENARRTLAEQDAVLREPVYVAPNGTALARLESGKSSDYERIVNEVAKSISNSLLSQTLSGEGREILSGIRDGIQGRLIEMDIGLIQERGNSTAGVVDTCS